MTVIAEFADRSIFPPAAFIPINDDYEILVRPIYFNGKPETVYGQRNITIIELYSRGGVERQSGLESMYNLKDIYDQPEKTLALTNVYAADGDAEQGIDDCFKKAMKEQLVTRIEKVAELERLIATRLIEEGILGADGTPADFEAKPMPPNFRDPQTNSVIKFHDNSLNLG